MSLPVFNLRHFLAGGVLQMNFVSDLRAVLLSGETFFVIEGHEIHPEEIQLAYDVSHQLFDLGPEVLGQYEDGSGQVGYISFGTERAVGAEHPDNKAFYQVVNPHLAKSQTEQFTNLWPKELAGFRPVMLSIDAQLDHLGLIVLRAMALALLLPENFLVNMVVGGPHMLRIINYPPLIAGRPGVRAEAHEDINMVSELVTADGGGLEVRRKDGTWMPVNIGAHQVVINPADMLEKLTGNRVKSVTHRVVNPKDPAQQEKRRLSIVRFVHPRDEIVLSEQDDLTGGKPLTAKMFLDYRLWDIGLRPNARPTWLAA